MGKRSPNFFKLQFKALARAGKGANGPTCLKRSPVDAML
jgi:hypothetical protein